MKSADRREAMGASGVEQIRNFILHYHLAEPELRIYSGSERRVQLLLDANTLLFSGFKWTRDARSYLQSNDKLDLMHFTRTAVRDVSRLVRFHGKVAENRLTEAKFAYDTYVHERARYHPDIATFKCR